MNNNLQFALIFPTALAFSPVGSDCTPKARGKVAETVLKLQMLSSFSFYKSINMPSSYSFTQNQNSNLETKSWEASAQNSQTYN